MLWNDSTDIHDFFAGGSLEYGSNPCNWPDPRSPHLINLHLSLQPQGRKAQLSPQMPGSDSNVSTAGIILKEAWPDA